MSGLLARLGSFAPFLVFVLAAAESAAFVGLAVPGELAVILGGVASGTGNVALWQTMTAAVTGAIVGDSIGYRLGSRTGPSLLSHRRTAKVAGHLDRASRLIGERGWWAIVLARFVAVLRAVVPFAAGMGGMPYRKFLLGNTIGGLVWGVTFTLVGHFAGTNYPTVERWARRGGLAVVAVLTIVGSIAWATRWARAHRTDVLERARGLAERRPVRWAVSRIRGSERPASVLGWTAAAMVAGLWLFAGLIQDVVGSEEFFLFDRAAIDYLDRNRIGALISLAKAVDALTAPVWLLLAITLFAALALFRRRSRVAVAISMAAAGQWGIVELTAALIQRTPPAATPLVARMDYGFPSEHVALLTAAALLAAWPWDRPGWRPTVTRFGVATLAVAVTGMARVILLIEYPSDTLAAASVATAWTLLVCLALDRRHAQSEADTVRPKHRRD